MVNNDVEVYWYYLTEEDQKDDKKKNSIGFRIIDCKTGRIMFASGTKTRFSTHKKCGYDEAHRLGAK